VKKIFGILVALSLVLSLAVMATPVLAKVTDVEVHLDAGTACSGQVGAYNISFDLSASLTEGMHTLCIKFPAGTVVPNTGYPTPWFDDEIETDVGFVYGSEVTVTGTEVCFLVPTTMDVGPHWVYFNFDACIINPETPGAYQLEVYSDRAPDTTPVKNIQTYKIVPCFSTYVFQWDSSPTYPGIAKDFVPPFKACGQNCSAVNGTEGCVECGSLGVTNMSGFLEAFNIAFGTVSPSLVGCEAPCGFVDIYLQLTESPQVPCGLTPSSVTLNLTTSDPAAENITGPNCNCTVLTWEPCKDADGIPTKHYLADNHPLIYNTTIEWAGLIHFDRPGDYTICFTAECVGGFPACTPPNCENGNILAQRCIDFKVYQMKDAAKLQLDEKWNLISLPLVPFDTDLCNMLASVDTLDWVTFLVYSDQLVMQDNLLSIWNYDAATEDWLVYGNGQDSLTTIEDGKAYWFRLRYPLDSPAQAGLYAASGLGPPGLCGNYSWWVFGTELPEPPDGPRVYSVEAGWNMVGFTSMSPLANNVYLANWNAGGTIPPPVIMGWNHGCFPNGQGWYSIPFGGTTLTPGQGYWIAFPFAGVVYQNVP
jgi:hypothetical protein